ncbi:FkbM family methyltransferase [Streptomyces kunmingensis]|uniref:FkbM family methyltransferase n=1 Tax=Streptomyces kunmingensis TaxID=68225 RepID=A0ABU6CFV1_9ACTN|nr:FkbM family methyltransferase [Streptomyces kunmingensis]MEB3963579.1 FkbM family methyltransferase [Streptomyces kunmingensis]
MTTPASDLMTTLGRRYVRYAPGNVGKGLLAAQYLNSRLRDTPRQRVAESRHGDRFALDTRDLIQRYLYLFGVWEPHMTRWLESRLRPGDVLVDVGANIGAFSVLGSRLVGGTGRVVAIEASPAFHRRVLQHAELNHCDNIRAVNTAVSDERKTLSFVLASSNNMGANSIVPYDGPAESAFEIEALPLTEVLEPDEVARARVIKIDVEGAEGSVVRGLAPLLDDLRPDAEIAVEITPERMEQLGDSADELLETMRKHGFHRYRLPTDYAAAGYPRAIRRPAPPVRWREPITGETELIFSRTDAEILL